MSNTKNKKRTHGGAREGAGRKGRKEGTAKICVSVSAKIWEDALALWNKPGSQLVDRLLMRFVSNEVTL